MVSDTTESNTPAVSAFNSVRKSCSTSKRILLAITNVITVGITAYYLSQALGHQKIITGNISIFAPFASLDLSQEKTGSIVAIARLVYLGLFTLSLPFIPDSTLLFLALTTLAFDIPLAIVAQSTFGDRVAFSTLDLTPKYVNCYLTTQPVTQFFTTYARLVNKPMYNICKEFVAEGSRLRSSLFAPWYMIPISLVLAAAIFTSCAPEGQRKFTDFLILLTGWDSKTFKWKTSMSARKSSNGKGFGRWLALPKLNLRSRFQRKQRINDCMARTSDWVTTDPSTSDSATLVDEEMAVIELDEKKCPV